MRRSLRHLGEVDYTQWRDEPDFILGPFWTGSFAPELKPRDYGDNSFHGRFHPAIPWVAMRRFTKRGEVVWDPFAGSGTTIDVGRELGRRVIANDLHTTRDDILQQDTCLWCPGEYVDLVIMHPPYMNAINYKSKLSDTSNVKDFIDLLLPCMYHVDLALKSGRVLVVVIGEVWVNGTLVPLEYAVHQMITGVPYGYRLFGRIVKDFGETKKRGVTNNLWKCRLLKNGYFKIGIDTILFFQKRDDR